ncbi:MAG: protein BatD [Bacteroidetes bacterium]|nr:protein BatD [Bacteroidota bacterium]
MNFKIRHTGFPRPVRSVRPDRSWILTLLVVFVVGFGSFAQQATATLDSNQYRIGEWIPLTLEVTAPSGAIVLWPDIKDKIEELEVLKRSEIDSVSDEANSTFKQTLTLMVFDSGYYPLPAFHFLINGDTISTTPDLLRINSVPLDTADLDIKPIKEPIKAPVTLREIIPWILGGVGLILLLVLLWLYMKSRKKKPEEIKKPEIIIPAHEWAQEELEKLRREELWQNEHIKQYYSRLTDIMRQYIELRYKQPAMESTTDEIMDRLSIVSLDATMREQIKSTLVLGDFVKFAKAKPLAHEHETSYSIVADFVESTKIEETKSEEA